MVSVEKFSYLQQRCNFVRQNILFQSSYYTTYNIIWDTLRIFTSTLYGKTKTNPNPDPNRVKPKNRPGPAGHVKIATDVIAVDVDLFFTLPVQ